MKYTHTSLITALLLSSTLYAAQEIKIEQIEVTDTLTSKTIDEIKYEQLNDPQAPTASSTLSTETFTKGDIEKIKPKNVYEILNSAQSVNILYMGRKHPYTITFRGSSTGVGASSFGIILDGALLSDNTAMRILEVLPPEIIESLQIVRDSSALSLAPMQAFGNPNGSPLQGYIVIKTKKPLKNEGGLKIAYETFNTKKTNFFYGGRSDDIYYMGSVDAVDSQGKDGYNTAKEGASGFFKVGMDKDDFNIELSGFYSRYFQEIQKANLPISRFYSAYWKYQPFENGLVSLSMTKNWSSNQNTNITLSHAKSNWTHNQDTTGATYTYFVGSQTNDSVNIKHTMKLDDTILKVGGQAIWYDAPNGELFYEGYERKEQIYGAFIQAQHFISDKLIIDEAIRIDKKHIDSLLERYSPNVDLSYAGNLNNTKVSTINDKWAKATLNLALGALYKLDDKNSLTGKFAYASNSATSDITTSASGTGLEKEKQYRYEVGYEYNLNGTIAKANVFYYDISNLKSPYYIGTAANPQIVFSQYDQERYGSELSLEGKIDAFDYLLNYSYVKADNKNNEIPNSTASVKLGYTYKNINTNMTTKYVDGYESNFFTTDNKYHKVGDFVVIDMGVDYKHKLNGYDAVASIYGKNITDKRYMTKIGWEDVGAIFGISYSIKF
ncbi:hypothetical protein CRV08_03135 [Halarcobacter ebronensis]|uniref:TonB-dependent receptor plug domain-containing protein n=1 Tax=Halarcobacter ebronensis TaxID=1462615 RepID=A0A4Q0YH95_9BACT|nr:TonB-dependent receptor plug domain-containing protein [Halarcobacter ebronensis]RXJ69713.1 hypothetical protein CRV08_03135 [Halarcobacter ebronensis]